MTIDPQELARVTGGGSKTLPEEDGRKAGQKKKR
jgi:hypothetical protein